MSVCQTSPKIKMDSKYRQKVFYCPWTELMWLVGNMQNNSILLVSNNDFHVNPCANTDRTEPARMEV